MTLRHFQICCYLQLNTQSENVNFFINIFHYDLYQNLKMSQRHSDLLCSLKNYI